MDIYDCFILTTERGEVYEGKGRITFPHASTTNAMRFKSRQSAERYQQHIDPRAKGYKPMHIKDHNERWEGAGWDEHCQ